jgi:transposase
VYLDESGFAQSMPRTHGYSPRGERCFGQHNWQTKERTNVIGALVAGALAAVCLFSCHIDSNVFHAWIINSLLPILPANTVIIMDNASFHKSQDTQTAIRQAGHILEYLPSYSPDLNPIEHKWAHAKAIRRKHQCSIEELFQLYVK